MQGGFLLAQVVQQLVLEPVPQPRQQLLHLRVVYQGRLVVPEGLRPGRVGLEPQRKFVHPTVEHAPETVFRVAPDGIDGLAQRRNRARCVGIDRHFEHAVLYA